MTRTILRIGPLLVAIAALTACTSELSTPTPDATATYVDNLLVEFSIPDHVRPQLSDRDIEYATDLLEQRSQIEPTWRTCYFTTLLNDVQYYNEALDLQSHVLRVDIPVGWIATTAVESRFDATRIAAHPAVVVATLEMAQNCEQPTGGLDHERQQRTFITIGQIEDRKVIELLADGTGTSWKAAREQRFGPDAVFTVLEITDRSVVDSKKLGPGNAFQSCCDDTRPNHFAYREADGVLYEITMLQTEGELSAEAFEHVLDSMQFGPLGD